MESSSRRGFLNTSAKSVAAVAATSTFTNSGFANSSSNSRIQIGFVGVGGRAGALLNMFSARKDVDVVALADIDSSRLRSATDRVQERKGKRPKSFGDFRHIIDDSSIDAVVVGTPDHWHAIPMIMACLANKDVYVEKPDGHNMLEGQRMVEAMKKNKRIVQLGTQARTSTHFQTAIDYVRQGNLGRVLVAKAWESAKQGSQGNPADGKPPAGVDYDMWIGPARKRPFNPRRFHGNWRWFFDYGSGDLGNDGVHRIDIARWALATAVEAETGKTMSALPRTISAMGGKWYFDDCQEWPDTLHVNYEYAVKGHAGRILTYEMKIWTPYKYMGETEGVVLFGDRGYIIIGNQKWAAYAPNGEVLAQGKGDNSGSKHVGNFLDCVRSRRTPNADLETVGHPSSIMCHAGNVAWKTGKQLQLDPETELFDDAKANEHRTRSEYRKPWVLPTV